MLLRSSSSPILRSSVPVFPQPESLKGLEPELSVSRCRSVQLSSGSSGFGSGSWDLESEIQSSPPQKFRRAHANVPVVVDRLESEKASVSGRKGDNFRSAEGETTSSGVGYGLGGSSAGGGSENGGDPVYIDAGLGIGDGGGLSGGGSRGGGGGGSSGADSNSTDAYYQKMLEENPGNPLLLRNYAEFLHEVQHDLPKAEEYYERAILANPGDGEVRSLYAKLIWEGHKDAARAENYFDQAVQTAPDDCYVLASYAQFLWDSEDNEVEEEGNASEPQHNIPHPILQSAAATIA